MNEPTDRTTPRFHFIALLAMALPLIGDPRASATDMALPDDEISAQILGSLVHTRVNIELHDCPPHEAFVMLGDAIGWTVIGFRSDEAIGEPGRTGTPITIQARDVSALLSLEMMIAQVATSEPVTWQIGAGVIEIGSKRRLAARRSGDARLYSVDDLAVDIPYFMAGDANGNPSSVPDVEAFNSHPYRPAALYDGNVFVHGRSRRGGGGVITQSREQLVRSLLRGIVDLVEPGNWDFGDELVDVIPHDERYQRGESSAGRYSIARVRRVNSTTLSILAPDFLHRALGGYPRAIVPSEEHVRAVLEHQPREERDEFIRFVRIDPQPATPNRFHLATSTERTTDRPNSRRREPALLLTDLRSADEARSRIASALEARVVPVDVQSLPVGEAIAEWSRLSGIPVVVRYFDDRTVGGVSPETRISIKARRLNARQVLEAIAKQCGRGSDPCTWQIRPGFVEIGTKQSLSVNAARELRVYNVRDQMMDIPDFSSEPGGEEQRNLPQFVALNLVDTIVGTIEPDAWDWGQNLETGYSAGLEAPHPNLLPVQTDPAINSAPAIAPGESRPTYVEHRRPAIIRFWGDVMIVSAPDFIHRQLGGYGSLPK